MSKFNQVPTTKGSTVPATRSGAALLRTKVSLVLSLILALAVIGPVSAVLTYQAAKNVPAKETIIQRPVEPLGRGAAGMVAAAWAYGKAYAGPAVAGVYSAPATESTVSWSVTWDSFTTVSLTSVEGVSSVYELHRLYVSTPGQKPLLLSVPMDITSGIPVLAASPTAEPAFSKQATASRLDYDQVPAAAKVPDAMKTQASRWAAAFVDGDSVKIKEAAVDQNPARTWQTGLGRGWVLQEGDGVQVRSGFILPNPVTLPDGRSVTVMVIRVVLPVVRPDGIAVSLEYDLMYANPTVAQPELLAWAPAGIGALATPYQNTL